MSRMVINFKGDYKNKVYFHFVIVGAGGNGSYVLQQLAQLFSIFEIRGKIVICDYDHYETKNLKNQLCLPKDIEKNKAEALAQRYRAAYNIDIASYSASYIEDIETLTSVFNTEYADYDYHYSYIPVLISCVDNNFTRKIFHEYFNQAETLLYIDCGNEATQPPEDFRTRPKEKWTKEELETYNKSGFTGQVIAGLKFKGKVISEPIASLFPDILEDNDEIAPSQLSCSELSASEPQRVITNRYSALAVNTILNEIFESESLSTHKIFFHSKLGYMRSEGIEEQ